MAWGQSLHGDVACGIVAHTRVGRPVDLGDGRVSDAVMMNIRHLH